MQELVQSRYSAGRPSQAPFLPTGKSHLPGANANRPLHLSRGTLLYYHFHLAEVMGRVVDARVSPDHDDGKPDCEISTACVRLVVSLSHRPRDGRCLAMKAAVSGLRMRDGDYHFPPTEVVSTFLVVRGTQPVRPLDGTNLCLQPAPVDLRSQYRSGALARPSSCAA